MKSRLYICYWMFVVIPLMMGSCISRSDHPGVILMFIVSVLPDFLYWLFTGNSLMDKVVNSDKKGDR